MKNYYDSYYQNMHNDVIAACNTIAGNPCSKLQSDFENLKSEINGLSLEDGWQDSVGDAFSGVKSSCIAGLDTIIQSIGSDFANSEIIYKTLKDTLDKLKTANEEYKTIYNEKPNKDSSKYYESDGKFKNSEYNHDYNNWQDKVKQKEGECETLQSEVITKKGQLDGINGKVISASLTASLPKQAETFASIFTTAVFSSVIDGIDISQFLTTMEFNGQTYQVIDTTNGYQAILNKIGKQNPDGCLDYSLKYLEAIFNSSNASSKSGVSVTQNLLATQDEQTALQIMAKELLEGRPCVIRVNGSGTGRHFVLVTGLNKNADLNNLKQSDFMIMDPVNANLKVLNTNIGGQNRHLLKTEDNKAWAGREGDSQGYLIAIANKDTEYLGYDGVEQGVAPHVNYTPGETTGTAKKAELAERARQAGVIKKTTPIIPSNSSQNTASPVTTADRSAVQYTTNIPSDLKQAGYTVTCYEADGFHRSGGSVGTSWKADKQIAVHNAWNADGSRYENGLAVINDNGVKRYLVATSEKLGKVGDRLTIHFNSGESINVLVADQKSSHDSNYTEYGHRNDSGSVNILEFEVNTQDYRNRGNPGTSNWKLSWDNSSGVASVDNHGSAINDLKGKTPVKA